MDTEAPHNVPAASEPDRIAAAVARATSPAEAAAAVAAGFRGLDDSAPFACLLTTRRMAALHLVLGRPASAASRRAVLKRFRDHVGAALKPDVLHLSEEVHTTIHPEWHTRDGKPVFIGQGDSVYGMLLSPGAQPAHSAWMAEIARWLQPVMAGLDRLLYESRWDPVTQVFNRRYLDEALSRLYAQADRHRHPLALVLVDVDEFKRINDRFGHLAGDRALREVGRALRDTVRAGDVVCRYGGDEFALLLPYTGLAGGQLVAERAARQVLTHRIRLAGHTQRLSISTGAAAFDPDQTTADTPSLLDQADQALRQTKQQRRTR